MNSQPKKQNKAIKKDNQLSSISNSIKPKKNHDKIEIDDELPDHLTKAAVPNGKLRNKLIKQWKHKLASQRAIDDYKNYLLPQDSGTIELENDLERTYRLRQHDIKEAIGISTAKKAFSLNVDKGLTSLAYTPDGRNLSFTNQVGKVASFDPTLGRLNCEINLNELCTDITYLHNSSMMAVAQKKYVYIYDNQGIELHKLPDHIEARRLEFLPHHFLLASSGNTGWLKYQDTSTGMMVSQHRTKLGPTSAMAQNPSNANISLGHQNGTVTFWTPSTPYAHVKLQAHLGQVKALSHDRHGKYIASAGLDGTVKLWDMRMWKELSSFKARNQIKDIRFSDKDMLAVGWGNHVYVYDDILKYSSNGESPSPYLTHHFPGVGVNKLAFCPYEDVLSVGHSAGLTNLIIPGSGEANYDSLEADPFEGKGARREREVRQLLDKIQPDLITFNDDILGSIHLKTDNTNPNAKTPNLRPGQSVRNPNKPKPYSQMSRSERLKEQGVADSEEEEDEDEEEDIEGMLDEQDDDGQFHDDMGRSKLKKKMRGRNSSTKKYLSRKRKNVIEPTQLALKAKLAKEKANKDKEIALKSGNLKQSSPSALDRFTKKSN
ncbi:BING4CT-domain-containing protein [Wallemia mellicola]|nr:BING4CT-domain-containing protein [Wallemia mellicola]